MTVALIRAFGWTPDVIGAQLVSDVELILGEMFERPEGRS